MRLMKRMLSRPTSSLTPQIASGWLEDDDLFARVFPMDLRTQAHDLIRTWLFDSVLRAHESAFRVITTSKLNQALERVTASNQPPMVNGRRIKLRYAHVGGHNPPRFIIHGKQTDALPDSYVRYLEKTFRKLLKMEGTPIRIELRNDENPFTSGEAGLDYQQVARKRRILKNREHLRARKAGHRK